MEVPDVQFPLRYCQAMPNARRRSSVVQVQQHISISAMVSDNSHHSNVPFGFPGHLRVADSSFTIHRSGAPVSSPPPSPPPPLMGMPPPPPSLRPTRAGSASTARSSRCVRCWSGCCRARCACSRRADRSGRRRPPANAGQGTGDTAGGGDGSGRDN